MRPGFPTGRSTISIIDSRFGELRLGQPSQLFPPVASRRRVAAALIAGEGKVGDKVASGRIGFAKGPFDLSLSCAESTLAAGDKFKQWVLGGLYDFGVAKAMAQWVQSKYGSVAGGARKQDGYEIGAIIPVSSHANLHLG